MANIIRSTADVAGFIPEAWAQKALDVLRSNIVLARLVAKDSDFEPGWQGKTLNIPYPGTFSAQTKSENGTASVQVPTGGTEVEVTLNKHKYVDFIIEDYARAQASSELLERWVTPAAIALAEELENDLFALYSGLSGSVGTTGIDLTAETIRAARKALNDNKVPLANRHMVISPKDEISLLADEELRDYFANSRPEAVAEGAMGRVYGFTLWMSQLVPVVTGPPDSTKNLAFTPEAFILATRPFRDIPAGSGVQTSTVRDAESGLVIRVIYSYDVSYRGMRIGFDILYGVKELRDACGIVVLS